MGEAKGLRDWGRTPRIIMIEKKDKRRTELRGSKE